MIYMVENGFADETREAAWSDWYSGHVRRAFRTVPGWRTAQRFVAIGAAKPRYRAFYTLDSASVLQSAEYKATTGGRFPSEWRELITDFRRNLADAATMPAVQMDQRLVVVDPPADLSPFRGVALEWSNVVGLDRSVPRRAIAVVPIAHGETIARQDLYGVGVYVPLFEQARF